MAETLEQRIKRLEDNVDYLLRVAKTNRAQVDRIDEQFCRLARLVADMARTNERDHEKLHGVFNKVFPDHVSYLLAFDRIVGPEVGPEDPPKTKDT